MSSGASGTPSVVAVERTRRSGRVGGAFLLGAVAVAQLSWLGILTYAAVALLKI